MTTSLEKSQIRSDLPEVNPGDKIKVYQRIKEGDKTRIAPFEGLVLARKHGKGITSTFTVRKVVEGVGVERIFPLHSPTITKIDILSRSKVRRAKLYYIRDKAAREVRRKMKNLREEAKVVEAPKTENAGENTKTAE